MNLPETIPIFWILILTCISLIWYYLQEKFSYWRKRGVPYISPLKGNLLFFQFMLQRKLLYETYEEQYKDLAGHKYGGSFQLGCPTVILRDPETIKTWLVKGFSHFHDRNPEPNEEHDKLSGNLFQLTGEKWRLVRQKLSAAFSSGKLKLMYPALCGCANDLDDYLRKLCEKTGELEVNIKELMNNYSTDVIGACAMGIKCSAIRDPECEFKRIVQKTFEFNWRFALYFLLELIHPKLPQMFGLQATEPEVEEFLRAITKNAVVMKAEEGATDRKDFLQILMNIQRNEIERNDGSTDEQQVEDDGPIFTEDTMVGVIGSFLSAGLEPVAATLTFCLYELALHPQIQDKIYREIQTIKKGVDGDISYEDLKKLRYTEQVINETLRKYPLAGVLSRECTEPFNIPGTDVVLKKGVKLVIPSYSLQHDPKYFPEPEKFDPERFSEENIDRIVPGSYLPFGDGPRFCIAMRFAMIDVKTMLITMVSNYTLLPCARTQKRLEYDKNCFIQSPKGGLWLQIKQRK